jgi:hypothetical protein
MSITSLRERLAQLEAKQRFLAEVLTNRVYKSLTPDEFQTYLREGILPPSLADRPLRLEGSDEKRLLSLWQEEQKIFEGRSENELKYYCDTSLWTEERGRFTYSMEDGIISSSGARTRRWKRSRVNA